MPIALPSRTVNLAVTGDEVIYLVPLLDISDLGDEEMEMPLATALVHTLVDGRSPETSRLCFRVHEPCVCTYIKTVHENPDNGFSKLLGTKVRLCVGSGSGADEVCIEIDAEEDMYELGQLYSSDLMPKRLSRAYLELIGLERRTPASLSAAEVSQLWGDSECSFEQGLRRRYPEAGPVLEPFYIFARFVITKTR